MIRFPKIYNLLFTIYFISSLPVFLTMTIFNLYIFTKRGSCIYYKEWLRPVNTLQDEGEDQKLMFGLLFSLKQLMNKMNPTVNPTASTDSSLNTQLPSFGPDQGFYRYATDAYILYHLETPTGYKFVLTSDSAAGDMKAPLWTIYSELFTNYALKNPLYIPGTPITNVGFIAAIDSYIRSLPAFNAR